MKNDLPYFSHDNDAHNHPKMKALRSRYGWTGYGQFWALNEIVAAAPECKLDLGRKVVRASVACELGLTPDGFEDFLVFLADLDECGLIRYEDGIVTTDRTQEDYQRIAPARQKARERWVKKTTLHEVSRTSPEVCKTSPEVLTDKNRVDKNREEDIKIKSVHPVEDEPAAPRAPSPKRFVKPTLEEIKAYCAERKNTVSPEKFLDYYESNGWRVGRNPMKDWKAAVRTWERNGLDKEPPKDTINGYKAQDAECPVCRGKIIGTLTTCMKCGYTKGDDTKDPENQAFYKANLERSKIKA